MHEELLRHIWARRLFDASRLATTDGRTVRIIETGTLNRGSGPDFHDAVVEIDETRYRGDIEFHRSFEDWTVHRHQHDPRYNAVVLHVVMRGPVHPTMSQSGRTIPALVLEPYLLTPLSSMADQLFREEYRSRTQQIRCQPVNHAVGTDVLGEWIRTMYRERLQEKVRRMYIRLCDIVVSQRDLTGEPYVSYDQPLDPSEIPLPDTAVDPKLFARRLPWEQLLYEEVMDCLGYSNNRAPMKRLAETLTIGRLLALQHTAEKEVSAAEMQALLFITSGLLPGVGESEDQDSKVYIHLMRTLWDGLPDKPGPAGIHPAEWNFSPTRPANFPTIRLAAAGVFLHRLLSASLFKSIITVTGGSVSTPASKGEQLAALFETGDDPFWNYHYSFTEPTRTKHAVLGRARTMDILVNAVVPFVQLYAGVFGSKRLSERSLSMAVELGPLEENTVLRQMNKQIIKERIAVGHAYQQQGIIQLYTRYCVPRRCGECNIGKALAL